MGKHKTIREGQIFGRRTVISFSYGGKRYGNSFWLCKCTCGTLHKVSGASLNNGTSKSCGCFRRDSAFCHLKDKTSSSFRAFQFHRKEKTLPFGESSFNKVFEDYVFRAKQQKLSFTLSKEKFRELTKQNCYYCGKPPSNTSSRTRSTGSYTYNGLDRIDNNKGYDDANVFPCCADCNSLKSKREFHSFIARVKEVANYLIENNII